MTHKISPAHTPLFRTLRVIALGLSIVAALSGCSLFGKGSGKGGSGMSESDLNAQREDRFADGSIPRAEGSGMFRDIPFDYDSSALSAEARAAVDFNVGVLNQDSALRIVLEGHCDERGTAEYNMALGAERAKAVRQLLMSLGIPSSRIETISYGEEVPLDTAHDEIAWSKNRRVHFSPYTDK